MITQRPKPTLTDKLPLEEARSPHQDLSGTKERKELKSHVKSSVFEALEKTDQKPAVELLRAKEEANDNASFAKPSVAGDIA